MPEGLSLYHAAGRLWAAYLTQGPGRLDRTLWSDVEREAQALLEDSVALRPEQQANIQRLLDLCRRCALDPAGLNFVTGEAGLVPRRDLHAEFSACLERLLR